MASGWKKSNSLLRESIVPIHTCRKVPAFGAIVRRTRCKAALNATISMISALITALPMARMRPLDESVIVANSRKTIVDAAALFERYILEGTRLVMDFQDEAEPDVESQQGGAASKDGALIFAETLFQKIGRALSSEHDSSRLADCMLELVTLSDMLDLDRQALTDATRGYRFDAAEHQTITFSAMSNGLRIDKVSEWTECHCMDRSRSTKVTAKSLLKSEMALAFLPARAGHLSGPLLTVALESWSYIGDTEIARRLDATRDGRTPMSCLVRLLMDLCARAGMRSDVAGIVTQQHNCMGRLNRPGNRGGWLV